MRVTDSNAAASLPTLTVGGDADLFAGSAGAELERAVLPAYLPRQRWFADKGRPFDAARVVDAVALDDDARDMLALVEIPALQRMYFLALSRESPEPGGPRVAPAALIAHVRGSAATPELLCDGFALDAVPRTLLADVRAGRRRRGARGGTFAAHAAPALATLDAAADPAVRHLSVEQSNTSVVVGATAMLKAYRRVHRGPQPELEIARFLDAVHYENTPALLGYLEYERAGDEPAALGILQRFVASDGDAWATTLAYLETALPSGAGGGHDAFFGRMRTLGRRTAELHVAFATPTGDPAFEPEATTADDIAAWTAQAVATADGALDALARERERVPDDLRAAAASLLERRAEMRARLALAPEALAGVVKTRYHGDFHLGQVLDVGDDFMIVDFEGEPGRDHLVRRRKSSPLRDVAGMIRSLDYAAVAGVRAIEEKNADGAALAAPARAWRDGSVAAFLDGYRTAIAGCASYPADPRAATQLLDLFVLEKAFYEMSYELANRPSWLHIPLAGIGAVVDGGRDALDAR